MLGASPSSTGYNTDDLAACIDTCFACAQACTACADACLGEEMVAELWRCITMDLNCADTGHVLSRQTGYEPELTRAGLTACRDACRRCEDACDRLLAA